ncbi:MAG: stage II sporulation protein M [Theionarchaea archaeon]|nr:stage II sporulation protein M [Theionarchaea archaeon]
MKRKINLIRVFLIIGITIALVSVRFMFSFSSLMGDDFSYQVSLLVKRGFYESFLALFLWAVLLVKTTKEDIKNVLSKMNPYIVVSALFLFGGVITGIFLQNAFQGLFQGIFEGLTQEAEKINAIPMYQQTFFIFGNNSGVAVICGIFNAFIPVVGALIPPVIMLVNGFVIGVAPAMFGIGWPQFLVAILPHGIFEIPALILASAVGLRFSVCMVKASVGFLFPTQGVSREEVFLREVSPGWQSLKLFVVIIPLLVVAGIVEVYISTQVMRLVGL